MKKIALILTALGVLLVGAGLSTPAAAYPPGFTVNLALTQQIGPPGFTFTATVSGCFPGEQVDFRLANGADTATTCSTTTFQASLVFNAPQASGTYTVTATLRGLTNALQPQGFRSAQLTEGAAPTDRPRVLTSSVTVQAAPTTTVAPGGDLPATGSSGLNSNITIGGIALLVGVGLLVVAGIRRREAASPSAAG